MMKSFAKFVCAIFSVTAFGSAASVRGINPGQRSTEIRTDDTVVRFAVERTVPTIVEIDTPGSHNWLPTGSESQLPTVVEIRGKEQEVHWSFARMSKNDRSITFSYEVSGTQLKADSTWSAVTGRGPVEHDVTLTNGGDSTIAFRFPPNIALTLKPDANHKLEHWWVTKGAGYEPETGGTFSEPITPGYVKVQHSGPYSDDSENRDAIPWIAIQDVNGKSGIYGGIEFSGWTEIKTERADTGEVALTMGMQLRDKAGKTRLKPEGTYHYPTCFVGAYQGDVDEGCNRLHRWVEAHLRPAMPWGITPVLVNNSWGSGMAVDETLARQMIDDCVALGIELYHIDAGWYEGVGNWHANPAKFPNGLENVATYAHSKGLKFGLWVGWRREDHPKRTIRTYSVFSTPGRRTGSGGICRRTGKTRILPASLFASAATTHGPGACEICGES